MKIVSSWTWTLIAGSISYDDSQCADATNVATYIPTGSQVRWYWQIIWAITQEVIVNKFITCPIGYGCRILRLLLCWGVTPSPNKCPVYNTKQSDGKVPVMLELWGMRSTPSLPSLPGPLWSRMVAPDRALSLGQIELNCILMLNWISWNKTVVIFKRCTYAKLSCLKLNCFDI